VIARVYRRLKRHLVKCGAHPIDAAFDAALLIAYHEQRKAYKALIFYKLAS
jgi:hypothetical protein